ncbi:amylo-alpha-1,6-glucosidase [Nocardioides gansuensis]|uniref:Amylo-alpha-1,6-glucosidase n=2 Tax=Nocardioides gansuensis TaxID=2138300 RepID=A0A2T8FAT4_9ACTN|nr:amylo-alpha-1,6-glucosidase [Nocardioides gansuensis]
MLLTEPDGQVRAGGVSGWYRSDVRLLDRLELSVDESGLELVRSGARGADHQEFCYVARSVGDPIPDPTVTLELTRHLTGDVLRERLVTASTAQRPVHLTVRLTARADFAPLSVVKQGSATAATRPTAGPGRRVGWRVADAGFELVGSPWPEVETGNQTVLTWAVALDPGESREISWQWESDVTGPWGRGTARGWQESIAVDAAAVTVRRTVEQSVGDLESLLLDDHGDAFLAAGSPWFLTLFGRDSLWAARMLVPFDVDLTLATLRVLARRQGRREDPRIEEEPGKILHEVRGGILDLGQQVLPPLYYGSVDATPLWVCALADAVDWGADPDAVRPLVPALVECLAWLRSASSATGWLRYVDHTGTGLSNQGWKDSHDSIQFADGRLAEPPIALSEVQAYAFEAATRGAALLETLGHPVPAGLREWAQDLRARFQSDFWVGDTATGHPALALDGAGHLVDSVASNMGHLLGTGILTPEQQRRVAELLTSPALDSGFGLRTLTRESPRFSRLSYHGGTVWPHDTAVAAMGLARIGQLEDAATLARGIFRAAEGFEHRLPELYGGDSAEDVAVPTSYPAACRPQAWSAAAPLAALVACLGVRVSGHTVTVPAYSPLGLGRLALHGLKAARAPFSVRVDENGRVTVELPEGSPLSVRTRD